LTGIYALLSFDAWGFMGPALALVAAAMLVVLLAENARIPWTTRTPTWN